MRHQGEFVKSMEYRIVNLPLFSPDPPFPNSHHYTYQVSGGPSINQVVKDFKWTTTRNGEVVATFTELRYNNNPIMKLTFYTE